MQIFFGFLSKKKQKRIGNVSLRLKRSLSVLNERERQVIMRYFGLDDDRHSYTLEEIGCMMDMTRERVRQVKDKALKKLRLRSKKSLQHVLNDD